MKQNIAKIEFHVTHFVGNQTNDNRVILSKSLSPNLTSEDENILRDHFLTPFNDLENFSKFGHEIELSLNDVYFVIMELFEDKSSFLKTTQNLSRLLLKRSAHPNIKVGDLHFVYFQDLIFDGEVLEGLGIFKTEDKKHFISSEVNRDISRLTVSQGVQKSYVDKGCLVFNTHSKEGFKVLSIDKTNRGKEAAFWNDTFLGLRLEENDYNFTDSYLDMCKSFIKDQIPEMDKTDKIEVVNRSIAYFKQNETFDKETFTESVFEKGTYRAAFDQFEQAFLEDYKKPIQNSFDISQKAVEKKSRSFKRVLKLDKNFHIYIHGSNDLIERGYDDKRKRNFYKIYFDSED